MPKFDEIVKKWPISNAMPLTQAESDKLKGEFEAYLQQDFNAELAAINSYTALTSFLNI